MAVANVAAIGRRLSSVKPLWLVDNTAGSLITLRNHLERQNLAWAAAQVNARAIALARTSPALAGKLSRTVTGSVEKGYRCCSPSSGGRRAHTGNMGRGTVRGSGLARLDLLALIWGSSFVWIKIGLRGGHLLARPLVQPVLDAGARHGDISGAMRAPKTPICLHGGVGDQPGGTAAMIENVAPCGSVIEAIRP